MNPDRLGPYRIEKLLGSGGMGAVYGGVNDQTGERAAIKVLAPQIAADETFRARFESEIETLKKLRHPNIVQLYGFGEYEGQLFYSMEWVSGSSLQEMLKEEGPLPWRDAVALAIDIAKSLKHAHDRGIIHRDLKPANLLIDDDGCVKLTDFGIAKLFGGNSLTAVGGVMGTADYMAPEQAAGKVLNHRVDLYSLGGVLYAMLTGRPPFLGNSLIEVLDMLEHDKPTPVSRLMPKIPREIDWVVMKLLEKDPAKRIPTALAAANQLRSLSHALSAERTAVSTDDDFQIADSATEVTPPSEASAKIAAKDTAYVGDANPLAKGGTAHGPADIDKLDSDEHHTMGRFQAKYYNDTAGEAPTSQQADDDSDTNHFTTVSSEELGAADSSQFEFGDEAVEWPRLILIAAGIAIIGALAWYTLRQPTADELWNDIQSIAVDDDPQRFYEAEEQIGQFLALYPDHEQASIAREYQEEIELMQLQRRMDRRLRRATDLESLDAVEQLYLEAMADAERNASQAVTQLESLVGLYEADAKADEQTQQIIDLARRQLERLRATSAKAEREHLVFLDERLKFAASLRRTNAAAAKEIYEAVIALYSDKPWAAKYVTLAQGALSEVENSQTEQMPEPIPDSEPALPDNPIDQPPS